MSNTLLIIGESGTGKSSSLRNLNPAETFVINVLDKPLPFRGFKKNYVAATKENPTGNYFASDDYAKIRSVITAVNERRPDIKNLIIDDWQYLLCNEFMRRATETGFTKFTEIGRNAWQVIRDLILTRSDLNCFVLAHSDVDANGKAKIKTIGKLLDEKVTVEGMFTVVLHSMIVDGQYKFLTQHDGTHVAKSPMDMFEDRYIDNDLAFVNERMNAYYDEDVSQ